MENDWQSFWDRHKIKFAIGTGLVVTAGGFIKGCYKVAKPGQILVRRGMGVTGSCNMDLLARGFAVKPFHDLKIVGLQPFLVQLDGLKCLSKQYLPFKLPVTYSIAPYTPDDAPIIETIIINGEEQKITVSGADLCKRYIQKLDSLSEEDRRQTLLGIIHGETRNLTATMSIDDMNDNRQEFHEKVVQKIQEILYNYGGRILGANISDIMEDERPGQQMGYLKARERKKLSNAVQDSEIDVAEAEKKGNIGKKEREAETRQQKARLEAETKKVEYEAEKKVAEYLAELEVVKAEATRKANVANIESNAASQQRKQELQAKIEQLRAQQFLESKRADELTTIRVQAEKTEEEARGRKAAIVLDAEGRKTAAILDAQGKQEADMIAANVNKQSDVLQAEADLVTAQHQATGIKCLGEAKAASELNMLEAKAMGMEKLKNACPEGTFVETLNIQHGIPQAIAESGARALTDMRPQIYSFGFAENAGQTLSKFAEGVRNIWQGRK